MVCLVLKKPINLFSLKFTLICSKIAVSLAIKSVRFSFSTQGCPEEELACRTISWASSSHLRLKSVGWSAGWSPWSGASWTWRSKTWDTIWQDFVCGGTDVPWDSCGGQGQLGNQLFPSTTWSNAVHVGLLRELSLDCTCTSLAGGAMWWCIMAGRHPVFFCLTTWDVPLLLRSELSARLPLCN